MHSAVVQEEPEPSQAAVGVHERRSERGTREGTSQTSAEPLEAPGRNVCLMLGQCGECGGLQGAHAGLGTRGGDLGTACARCNSGEQGSTSQGWDSVGQGSTSQAQLQGGLEAGEQGAPHRPSSRSAPVTVREAAAPGEGGGGPPWPCELLSGGRAVHPLQETLLLFGPRSRWEPVSTGTLAPFI